MSAENGSVLNRTCIIRKAVGWKELSCMTCDLPVETLNASISHT